MKKRLTVTLLAATITVLAITLSAAACQFSFNYTEITAPLGTVGEIGVRVQKDHNNCTLPSMDDYQFAWENIQVLGETAWEGIGPDLYERWFQVSLSEIGDGYLMISKDCTKEGYEEAKVTRSYKEDYIRSQSLAAVHFNPENIFKRLNLKWAQADEESEDVETQADSEAAS